MTAKPRRHIFTMSCRNRPGIVAAVSAALFANQADILEAQQFDDPYSDQFFMRILFARPETGGADALRAGLAQVCEELGASWSLRDRAQKKRTMLLVSRFDHCLIDLLYRWRIGELDMDPVAIVSNHARDTLAHVDFGPIPFYHFPVTKLTKMEQEADLWRLMQELRADLVVLARYMQILSDGLAAKLAGRCINIHHSFLPSFKGAQPYHQAHARGVKLIGATAHYVTAALDEGPIIEQDVERISHRHGPEDLARIGRDIERRVLARAVRLHLEDRVLLNGSKTVVFAE
jgi:formyltetrahydrofolate deformylase